VIGQVAVQTLTSGDGSVTLPFASTADEFTLVIEASTPSAAGNIIRVTGSEGAVLSGGRTLAGAMAESPAAGESYIRQMERELLGQLPRGAAVASRGLMPADENEEAFFVVNKTGSILLTDPTAFDQVSAFRRYDGTRALIYVDERDTAAFTEAEIQALGSRFDTQTYPTDVAAFGAPSDIDGNGKVVILLSRTVNALTTPELIAQGARVVGFFFGVDLIIDPVRNPHGNNREVFYGVVPNENEFPGARVTHTEVVNLLGGVFAHEFEHMISFNQHALIRNGNLEDVWLDEGLAHMAEQLNGFVEQNRFRSAFFLDSPSEVALVSEGDGLDERGAAWLFVQYMYERFGGNEVLNKLVQTNLVGTQNVSSAAGRSFITLFHEWANMLLLDGPAIPGNDPIFELGSIDLRSDFEAAKAILGPTRIPGSYLDRKSSSAGTGASFSLTQKGTSALYVAVTSTRVGNAQIAIDGQPAAGIQVSIIRTR